MYDPKLPCSLSMPGLMSASLLFVAALAIVLSAALAEKEPILYCDTCKGMVDEINWAMDQGLFPLKPSLSHYLSENPRARIDVRLVRLDDTTKDQRKKSVNYRTSETFFTDVGPDFFFFNHF